MLFNNQSTELSSWSENDNTIQEGEVNFEKRDLCSDWNLSSDLSSVSKLIDSVGSKIQGDQKKYSFLETRMLHKREIEFIWTPTNTTPIDGSCYEAIDSSISQERFSDLKILRMQCTKNIRVEDNKKEWV